MLTMLIMTTMLFYDPGVNLTPYMEALPAPCPLRIDIVNRTNNLYNGYAWFSGRVTIYDGNKITAARKLQALKHEIGHVCNPNNRRGSYEAREANADT